MTTPSLIGVRGYALSDLSNVDCADLQARLATCGGGDSGTLVGIDLAQYVSAASSTPNSALGNSPLTWTDVWPAVQLALNAGRAAGLPINFSNMRGLYYINPPLPMLVPGNSGMIAPAAPRCQLSYSNASGTLVDYVANLSFAFLVDAHSTHNQVPKFALQGGATCGTPDAPVQIVVAGLINDAASVNVSAYPTITGVPAAITNAAPIVCTDHRHDTNGNAVTSAKAGNCTAHFHIVGAAQGAYFGDPLVSEEPWATSTASGLQTGIGFTTFSLTGYVLQRFVGIARSTAGGLVGSVNHYPPYWTGISQPNSGGVTNYSLLKVAQRNCRIVDMWHRAVGFSLTVIGRGARYGVFMQAGYNALGPVGQDTGKYNSADIYVGGERIITALHLEPNSYGHDVTTTVAGHFMDEYALNTETGSIFEIMTNGAIAGAIDKAVYSPGAVGVDYAIDDKASDGSGNVFSCIVAGTSSVVPTSSGPNYNATTLRFTDPGTNGPVWIFRNGGFKPVGAQAFAKMYYKGFAQEASGRILAGNVNDGHLWHDASGLIFTNWSQAKTHHADAAFYNPSTTTNLILDNIRFQATGNSQRVVDVANQQNLFVGNWRAFGYAPLPTDGTVPTVIGGNIPEQFWWQKNIQIAAGGMGTGDDDGDESNA